LYQDLWRARNAPETRDVCGFEFTETGTAENRRPLGVPPERGFVFVIWHRANDAKGHFRTHAVHKYRSSEGGHRSRTNEAASCQQSVREGHSCPGRMRTRRSESTTAGDLTSRCLAHGKQALPHEGETPKDCDRAPNEESCTATLVIATSKEKPGIEHRMPKANPNRRRFRAYSLVEVALRRPVHPAFIGRPPGATMPHRCNSMKTAEFD
jgi:hypothetical protein